MASADVARTLDLPTDQVGQGLLSLAEDQWFDRISFKTSPKRLAEVVSAMANADGGLIIVGITDTTVEGTDRNPRHRDSLASAAVELCFPPVRAPYELVACVNQDSKEDHLLVIDVNTSDMVHSTTDGDVLLRVGDTVRQLSFRERQELLYDKGQASYEGQPVQGVDDEDIDWPLVQNYTDRMGYADARKLLVARGLLSKSEEATIAGYLLFGALPQERFPSAHVRVSRFHGLERGLGSRQQLIDDIRCEGPIPRLLMQARREVQRLQPTRRALAAGGTFEDTPLVPEDAWLEGLVNAVVHRSYSMSGDHIHVNIFDDRIEIESPGRFPGLVNLDDPRRATRFARNPRIARVCADLRFGQEFGEGILRMFEEMRLAGLSEPIYRQTAGSVKLLLSGEPASRAIDAQLPSETRLVVAALRENGRLSTGDLANVMHLSRPAAIRKLGLLRDAGVLEWVGKSPRDPRAYWRLAES